MTTIEIGPIRFFVLVTIILASTELLGQTRTDVAACPEVITNLIPQRVFKKPTRLLRRVEIRSCLPGETENLQFVAWENNAMKPSLVVTTSDETIVQLVMSGDVFVIETTGGSHDSVFVIQYGGAESFRHGKPRLALDAVTKGHVVIKTDPYKVTIDYPDLRGETHHIEYSTGLE